MSDQTFKIHYSCGAYEADKTVSGKAEISKEVAVICHIDNRVRRSLTDFINSANVNESITLETFTGTEVWVRVS